MVLLFHACAHDMFFGPTFDFWTGLVSEDCFRDRGPSLVNLVAESKVLPVRIIPTSFASKKVSRRQLLNAERHPGILHTMTLTISPLVISIFYMIVCICPKLIVVNIKSLPVWSPRGDRFLCGLTYTALTRTIACFNWFLKSAKEVIVGSV